MMGVAAVIKGSRMCAQRKPWRSLIWKLLFDEGGVSECLFILMSTGEVNGSEKIK